MALTAVRGLIGKTKLNYVINKCALKRIKHMCFYCGVNKEQLADYFEIMRQYGVVRPLCGRFQSKCKLVIQTM